MIASSQEKSEPFIKPNLPIVLKKTRNRLAETYNYFYMIPSLDFKQTSPEGNYAEKFTIKYCQLEKDVDYKKNLSSYYNSYSILIKNKNKKTSLFLKNAKGIDESAKDLDIIINPKGKGIGSIILNHLFYWAKENYPELNVPKLDLSSNDRKDKKNKARQNKLYKKIGLIGRNAAFISDLTPSIKKRGYKIYTAQEFLENPTTDESLRDILNKLLSELNNTTLSTSYDKLLSSELL